MNLSIIFKTFILRKKFQKKLALFKIFTSFINGILLTESYDLNKLNNFSKALNKTSVRIY